jgi:uncharacterized membrane protein
MQSRQNYISKVEAHRSEAQLESSLPERAAKYSVPYFTLPVNTKVLQDRDSRDHCRYYLVAHQTQLIDACNKTEDPAARAAIIQARIQETLLITQVFMPFHSNQTAADWD